MVRYAKRTDDNHQEIRDALRKLGFPVLDLSNAGWGVPDLCVMVAPGKSLFLELKDGNKSASAQKLTEQERKWQYFNGSVTVTANSLESALAEIKKYRGEK
jgi:hypothetical protein